MFNWVKFNFGLVESAFLSVQNGQYNSLISGSPDLDQTPFFIKNK